MSPQRVMAFFVASVLHLSILVITIAAQAPQQIFISVTGADPKTHELIATPVIAPHLFFRREGADPGKGLLGPCTQVSDTVTIEKQGVTFTYPVVRLDCHTTILTFSGVSFE